MDHRHYDNVKFERQRVLGAASSADSSTILADNAIAAVLSLRSQPPSSSTRSAPLISRFSYAAHARRLSVSSSGHEAAAREMWITTALDPWAKRHGLTRAQALSVAFDDSAFNPANPQRDQVTLRDLYAWNGQEHGFAAYLRGEGRDETAEPEEEERGFRPQG